MKVVLGLGNPGPEFRGTRHNFGFYVIDKLSETLEMSVVKEQRLFWIGIKDDICLCKSKVFMNSSGIVAKRLMDVFNLEPSDLLVVHDDLYVNVGDFRFKNGGGYSGHRGVGSVAREIKSRDFLRLRCGIGPIQEGTRIVDFVLESFDEDELSKIQRGLPDIIDDIKRRFLKI